MKRLGLVENCLLKSKIRPKEQLGSDYRSARLVLHRNGRKWLHSGCTLKMAWGDLEID